MHITPENPATTIEAALMQAKCEGELRKPGGYEATDILQLMRRPSITATLN
jgi:hypothetical protein